MNETYNISYYTLSLIFHGEIVEQNITTLDTVFPSSFT